jgi:TctA family transporter
MDIQANLTGAFTLLLSVPALVMLSIGLFGGLVTGYLPAISPLGGIALAYFVALLLGGLTPELTLVLVIAFAYATLYGRAYAAMHMAPPGLPETVGQERLVLIVGLFTGINMALVMAVQAVAVSSTRCCGGPRNLPRCTPSCC